MTQPNQIDNLKNELSHFCLQSATHVQNLRTLLSKENLDGLSALCVKLHIDAQNIYAYMLAHLLDDALEELAQHNVNKARIEHLVKEIEEEIYDVSEQLVGTLVLFDRQLEARQCA
uniref:hypothetical protein n=1 Tax=Ningiella ruwaisensis TaxID=2364274 RepID=UPI00109F03CE|nr:hypothetical protein [Ningiella ruwaisensis]